MKGIFDSVYRLLKWLSAITGLTYHEINIVVYYILVPLAFMYLIDRIFKSRKLVIGFIVLIVIALLLIPDFSSFSTNLFNASVDFLKWFDNIGLNYVQASVVICVVVPTIVILGLIYIIRKRGNRTAKND